jgi:hypothetical protein
MNKAHFGLMAIQRNLHAPKSQRNTFGNYNYRSCEDILEAVKPLLAKNECTIIIKDELVMVGERVYVKATAIFTDVVSGDSVEASAYAREELSKKGMDAAQLTGATSSYARKYALNALLLIDDNKDADSTNKHEKDDLNYEINSGSVGMGKPASIKSPAPIPAPAPTPAPARTAPDKNGDTLLEEKTRNVIISNFDNIGVEIWDLTKHWGDEETWTKAKKREMFDVYNKITNEKINYSVKDFLEGK